jgi:hypothetical protein
VYIKGSALNSCCITITNDIALCTVGSSSSHKCIYTFSISVFINISVLLLYIVSI